MKGNNMLQRKTISPSFEAARNGFASRRNETIKRTTIIALFTILLTTCMAAQSSTTYQGTAAANTLTGTAHVDTTCTGCPNGVKIGGLGANGANDNAITFNNISASTSGNYNLTIFGVVSGTESYGLSVNGGAPINVPLTGTSWTTPAAPVTLTIPLNSGSDNTITFGNSTNWSPDVVYIVISPTPYWAYNSNNTLSGGAIEATCAGCPQGTKVGSLGYGASVTINNVYAPTAGNFTLTILGCVSGTESYQVTVNGGTPITVSLSGTSWTSPASPVNVTIPLTQGGSNTIKFGNATNWSPDVVSIGIAPVVSGSKLAVTSFTPMYVPITGGQLSFTGLNFTSNTTVTLGSVAAPAILFQNSSQFTVPAPASATLGPVNVVVSSSANGSSTISQGLTYVEPPACQGTTCTYQSWDPQNTLAGGAAVAACAGCPYGLKVGNLGYTGKVTINNIYAPTTGNYTLTLVGCEGSGTQDYAVIVNGGTPISVPLTGSSWTSPAAPTSIVVGLVAGNTNTIQLGNAGGYSPDSVSIEISPAATGSVITVASVNPNQVPLTGGQVTITGTNFTPTTTVTFGGVATPPISYTSSTKIAVMAPALATAGAVDVVLDSTNGTATLSKGETYVEPTACQSATCVYQAWDPKNTLTSPAVVAKCDGCPYGLKVGSLGYNGAVTINNVYAPAAGQYILTIVGCEGSGTQSYQVTTNSGTPVTIPLTGNNWFVAAPPVSTIITLNAGSSNKIVIGNAANWSPDVVYVVVSPANVISNPPSPQLITMSSGPNEVQYNLSTGLATYWYNGVTKIAEFYSQAYNGATLYQSTSSLYTRASSTGANGETDITLTPSDGSPTMIQRFTLSNNHFLVQVEMDGANVTSNQMSPIVVNQTGAVDLGSYTNTIFLTVPFDNDDWTTYNAAPSNGLSTLSYEVGAFYDNTSRNGLVVGSVTHDQWKTGIAITGNNNRLDALWAFGGANDPWDSLPHAAVSGTAVKSPIVMVGYYTDWRTGMEDYATTNAQYVPKLSWTGPTPMGAAANANNSSLNLASVEAVENYFHTSLPNFNNQGISYFDMDSQWTDLSDSDLAAYVSHAHSQGQKAGVYWTPWIVWSWTSLSGPVDGAPDYTFEQIVMKDTNGNPLPAVDGAYAVDPTHPGTIERIGFYANKFKTAGFDYIKLDFLGHGILEGGSNNGVHYNPAIQTGVQAYNQGMTTVYQQLGTSMFIDESIAPIFPYQYGHARRVSCDTYGSISQTSYEMNSASYGWWLAGRVYAYNDPDNIRLEGYTSYENKSRVTSTAIEGYMLDSDDVTDSVAPGLLQTWLTNASINSLPALGLNFIPVEGNTGTSPVNVLVAQSGSTYYLAVFNYNGSSSAQQVITLSRAGLSSTNQYSVTDLWSGATSKATGTLTVSLNPAESTILKLQ